MSDATFVPRNWQEMIAPGYGFDTPLQLKVLQWIKEQAAMQGCVAVLCSYDPDVTPHEIEVTSYWRFNQSHDYQLHLL